MSTDPAPGEAKMEAVLAQFGWTCGDDFWKRYYTDPWVFNLANAIERLTDENVRLAQLVGKHDPTGADHMEEMWVHAQRADAAEARVASLTEAAQLLIDALDGDRPWSEVGPLAARLAVAVGESESGPTGEGEARRHL